MLSASALRVTYFGRCGGGRRCGLPWSLLPGGQRIIHCCRSITFTLVIYSIYCILIDVDYLSIFCCCRWWSLLQTLLIFGSFKKKVFIHDTIYISLLLMSYYINSFIPTLIIAAREYMISSEVSNIFRSHMCIRSHLN